MIRNPEIQFASADAIAAFQEERLRDEVAYLYENSPYYRRMFDGCGMQPGDIRTADDLRHLPVTTKTDLQLHPGEFVCVPRNRIIDYVTTSGTLGDPVTFALTEEDLARLAYNEAMSFTTAGCTGEDILQLMTTIDRRFMAGLAYFMGARELGCGVIRVGNGIPELQWDTIRRIGPTGCIVVPSFLIKLVGYAQEHGIDYRRSSLRRAICIGEALRDTDFSNNTLGAKITELWPELELFSTYRLDRDADLDHRMRAPLRRACSGRHASGGAARRAEQPRARGTGGRGGHYDARRAGHAAAALQDGRHLHRPHGTLRLRPHDDAPLVGDRTPGADDQIQGHDALPARAVRRAGEYPRREQLHHRGIHRKPRHRPDRSTRRDEAFEKEIKDTFRSKVRVAPEVVFEQVEYIAKKQMPQMSRKQIKFVDLREQTK